MGGESARESEKDSAGVATGAVAVVHGDGESRVTGWLVVRMHCLLLRSFLLIKWLLMVDCLACMVAAASRLLDHAASVSRVAELLAPGVAPKHVYTLRWEKGDMAIWHNVGVCHSTEHYNYDTDQRYMHNLNRKGPVYQEGAWARVGPRVHTRSLEEDPDAYKRLIAGRRRAARL